VVTFHRWNLNFFFDVISNNIGWTFTYPRHFARVLYFLMIATMISQLYHWVCGTSLFLSCFYILMNQIPKTIKPLKPGLLYQLLCSLTVSDAFNVILTSPTCHC
jgi:hypothetical protein